MVYDNDQILAIFQGSQLYFLRGMIMKMCQHGIILPFMCMEKSNYEGEAVIESLKN
jgi:hypothetical protein